MNALRFLTVLLIFLSQVGMAQVANTAINRVAWLDQHNINWYYETSGMDLSSCDWQYQKKNP